MRTFVTLLLLLLALACRPAAATPYGDFDVIQEFVPTDGGGTAITSYGGGLAFDGTDLWYTTTEGSAYAGKLYQISPVSQKIIASWSLPFEPHGIAWDGTQLWIADSSREPRVRAYDRSGNPLGSHLVAADSSYFHGMTWGGGQLWGADDWFLMQFDAGGTLTHLHSTAWLRPFSPLAFDGTYLWTIPGAGAVRIDPNTGHFSDFRKLPPNDTGNDVMHLAIGAGRMFFARGGGLQMKIREVHLPGAVPFPALAPDWGVFHALEGFAVPQRSGFLTGSGLGCFGTQFWYCDAFNTTKVTWLDHSLNTAPIDLSWQIRGGQDDVTSDGTHVWVSYLDTSASTGFWRVGERSPEGTILSSFPVLRELNYGLAWDGQALWTGGRDASTGLTRIARYSTTGTLLSGPFVVGTGETQMGINDLAWHGGELWFSTDRGRIGRIDPANGTLLGYYLSGPIDYDGIASDGSSLYVVAKPGRTPSVLNWETILRLGIPDDMVAPRTTGGVGRTTQVTVNFSEALARAPFVDTPASYTLESPIGTPVSLASATIPTPTSPPTSVTISNLSLVAGSTFRLSVRRVRDLTGNLIREDGTTNVITGVISDLDPPTNLTAAAANQARVDLAWKDGSPNETGFRVERKVGAAGAWSQIADLPTANGPGTGGGVSYADTGVTGGLLYTYRVRAYGPPGLSAYTNEASATTPPNPPGAPTKLSAVTVSQSQVNLTWTDGSIDEDGFTVERRQGMGLRPDRHTAREQHQLRVRRAGRGHAVHLPRPRLQYRRHLGVFQRGRRHDRAHAACGPHRVGRGSCLHYQHHPHLAGQQQHGDGLQGGAEERRAGIHAGRPAGGEQDHVHGPGPRHRHGLHVSGARVQQRRRFPPLQRSDGDPSLPSRRADGPDRDRAFRDAGAADLDGRRHERERVQDRAEPRPFRGPGQHGDRRHDGDESDDLHGLRAGLQHPLLLPGSGLEPGRRLRSEQHRLRPHLSSSALRPEGHRSGGAERDRGPGPGLDRRQHEADRLQGGAEHGRRSQLQPSHHDGRGRDRLP